MRQPGDLVVSYGEQKGWRILTKNIMVEGDSDVRYFNLMERLYLEKIGKSLIGKDLAILSAGSGDNGGTDGIHEEFPVLYKLIKTDCNPQNNKAIFRLVTLLDNDAAGHSLVNMLLRQYRNLQLNRDIFILNRVFPRTVSEHSALTSQMILKNSDWKGLDCEIEDLLSTSLIDAFLDEHPNALKKSVEVKSSKRHYEWTPQAKANLIRFAEKNSIYEDVLSIAELIISMRFYLGLPANGI